MNLGVTLGRLKLRNPILVASGTFGYARELQDVVYFSQLGGIIPKTVTRLPRPGNKPPRTVETTGGMLNAIGLDNDGIDYFLQHHVPYLRTLPTAVLATGLTLLACLAVTCGLVLGTVTRGRREIKLLAYLQQPAPGTDTDRRRG